MQNGPTRAPRTHLKPTGVVRVVASKTLIVHRSLFPVVPGPSVKQAPPAEVTHAMFGIDDMTSNVVDLELNVVGAGDVEGIPQITNPSLVTLPSVCHVIVIAGLTNTLWGPRIPSNRRLPIER
jgi:hypothetical protein